MPRVKIRGDRQLQKMTPKKSYVLMIFSEIFEDVKAIESIQFFAYSKFILISLGNKSFRKIHRQGFEKFEFEVNLFTDCGRHSRTSSTPCTVITLRGRRAIICFLLLYESHSCNQVLPRSKSLSFKNEVEGAWEYFSVKASKLARRALIHSMLEESASHHL